MDRSYIKDLYMLNSGKNTETPGMCVIPKLKLEHIKLTSFSKMRVDLAAQVRYLFSCHLRLPSLTKC